MGTLRISVMITAMMPKSFALEWNPDGKNVDAENFCNDHSDDTKKL